jgi:hypothetical protein
LRLRCSCQFTWCALFFLLLLVGWD